jgi:thioredoxin reductase (NADPH)
MVALEGDPVEGLTGALFHNRLSGKERRCGLRHLFHFIGADPNTGWLTGCVDLDAQDFVTTGVLAPGEAGRGRAVLPLETNLPGVFAIGDVLSGSTKRVAAAVGEGAAVVAQIHGVLALTR